MGNNFRVGEPGEISPRSILKLLFSIPEAVLVADNPNDISPFLSYLSEVGIYRLPLTSIGWTPVTHSVFCTFIITILGFFPPGKVLGSAGFNDADLHQ